MVGDASGRRLASSSVSSWMRAGTVELGVSDTNSIVKLFEHFVMTVGVFADVHGRQVEPKGGHVAHQSQQHAVCDELPGVGKQRPAHHAQFVEAGSG